MQGMDEVTGTAVNAANTIIEQGGAIGAMLVLSLIVNLLLGWLLHKSRNRYISHLEEHDDD